MLYQRTKKEIIPLIDRNILLNLDQQTQNFIKTEIFDWSLDDSSKLNPPFDIIVASDVVYYKEGYEPLLKSFEELSNSNTVILLAYKKRSEEEILFFHKLRHNFEFEIQNLNDDTFLLTITKRKIFLEKVNINYNQYVDFRNMAETKRVTEPSTTVRGPPMNLY